MLLLGGILAHVSLFSFFTIFISRHGDSVKHYHVKPDENNFYKISARHSFPTIPELIEYHKLNSGGLYMS